LGGIRDLQYYTMSRIINRFGIVLFAVLTTAILIFFDYCAKPQSDDWGWLVFLDEYGYWGTYQNMRATFQTSPYMLCVMFPVIALQKFLPYGFLLLIIQLTLPISLLILLRGLIINLFDSKLKAVSIVLTITNLTYLTAWNSNTFQNAVFWLTGALGYILPISFFVILIYFLKKHSDSFLEKGLIFILIFLLSGIQINYILIFGLVAILLIYYKFIYITKIHFVFSILSLIYTWSYPGWLNRIGKGIDGYDKSKYLWNFLELTFKSFNTEVYWIFSLVFFLLFVLMSADSNNLINFCKYTISKSVMMVLFVIAIVSNLLILFAFNGGAGYGRVHFLSHTIMVAFTGLISCYFVNKLRVNLLPLKAFFVILSLVVFLIPLKSMVYKAKKFSDHWEKRDKSIISQIKSNGTKYCVMVDKLSKSGILGYVDLTAEVMCSDNIGYGGNLEYPKIKNYDNWVFMKHYNTQNKIVLNKDVKNK
jgi:hypothetical protein